MPIDPGIALSGKPVQFDGDKILNLIAQGQQRRMAVESHQQQMQIGQQHIEAGQLAAREAQLKMRDDQLNTSTFQQAAGDPDKHVAAFAASGARPQAVQELQKHYAALREQYAKTTKDEAEVKKYTNQQLAGLTQQAMDDPNYEANWGQYVAAAKKIDPKAQLPDQAPPKDALGHIRLAYTTDEILHKEADEKRAQAEELRRVENEKQQSLIRPDQAREIKAKASAAESDAAVKQFELDAAKATPEQQAAKVAATIDQKKYPEIYKRTLANVTAGVTHAEKQAALKAGSAEVGEREKETDPAVAKARTDQAVATAMALSPIHVAEQVSVEVAKAKLAPESFASITDPRARASAEGDYARDSKEYADKVSEARRLKSLIAAAQNGNKAAPAVIPIEELRGFVNRVNAQELKRVSSGAGSAYDRVQGFISGYTNGQSIPAAILKDTVAIADLNEKAARAGYEMKVQVNNKTHGGNVKPIDFAQPKTTVTMLAPDGTTIKEVDESEVAHYEQLGAKRK